MAKSVNRQISYAVDLIAANEEMDHPETLQLITNTEWSVHRVSPLWNVQYKNKHNKRGATTLANESDFTLGKPLRSDKELMVWGVSTPSFIKILERTVFFHFSLNTCFTLPGRTL